MNKAQYRVYNRLAKKQVNRAHDVVIVEESETSITLFIAFPGIYLTYDIGGVLLLSETRAEREAGTKRLAAPGQRALRLQGELGGDKYADDDVPF